MTERRTQGQWNAYVETGETREERAARLEEVPEQWRKAVKRHVQTVFSIKRFYARQREDAKVRPSRNATGRASTKGDFLS